MILILFIFLKIDIVVLTQMHTKHTKLIHLATMNKLGSLKKNLQDEQYTLNQKIQLADICNQQIKTAMEIISHEIITLQYDLLSEI